MTGPNEQSNFRKFWKNIFFNKKISLKNFLNVDFFSNRFCGDILFLVPIFLFILLIELEVGHIISQKWIAFIDASELYNKLKTPELYPQLPKNVKFPRNYRNYSSESFFMLQELNGYHWGPKDFFKLLKSESYALSTCCSIFNFQPGINFFSACRLLFCYCHPHYFAEIYTCWKFQTDSLSSSPILDFSSCWGYNSKKWKF